MPWTAIRTHTQSGRPRSWQRQGPELSLPSTPAKHGAKGTGGISSRRSPCNHHNLGFRISLGGKPRGINAKRKPPWPQKARKEAESRAAGPDTACVLLTPGERGQHSRPSQQPWRLGNSAASWRSEREHPLMRRLGFRGGAPGLRDGVTLSPALGSRAGASEDRLAHFRDTQFGEGRTWVEDECPGASTCRGREGREPRLPQPSEPRCGPPARGGVGLRSRSRPGG